MKSERLFLEELGEIIQSLRADTSPLNLPSPMGVVTTKNLLTSLYVKITDRKNALKMREDESEKCDRDFMWLAELG